MPHIPKIMHFVWAGGSKRMPIKKIKAILEWKREHSDFEVRIWVDEKTEGKLTGIIDGYRTSFDVAAKALHYDLDFSQIQFKDITEEKVVTEFSRYEIDRLRPNYGASSDLLRYRILPKFGGMYADMDVYPGELPLDDPKSGILFDQELPSHQFFYDPNSQGTTQVGNDFFVCTVQNPVMKEIEYISEDNYKPGKRYQSGLLKRQISSTFKIFDSDSPQLRAYSYDKTNQIEMDTPCLTGPVCVKDIVAALVDRPAANITGDLNPIGLSLRSVRDHAENCCNDRSWMHMPLFTPPVDEKPTIRKDIVFNRAIESIKFEVNHMCFLRLDDHISNVLESLKISEADVKNTISEFLKALEKMPNIEYNKIQAIQITGRFIDSESFYKEHELFHLQKVFPDLSKSKIFDFFEVAHATNSYNLCNLISGHIEKSDEDNAELDAYCKQLIFDVDGGMLFIQRAISFYHQNIAKDLGSIVDQKQLEQVIKYFKDISETHNFFHNELNNLKILPFKRGVIDELKIRSDILGKQLVEIQEQLPEPTSKQSDEEIKKGTCNIV